MQQATSGEHLSILLIYKYSYINIMNMLIWMQ
jgi:hypothetical protein